MKFKKLMEQVPNVILPEKTKQKSARYIKTQNAIKTTELYKCYIESGAQYTMTFSQFKRKSKGKII